MFAAEVKAIHADMRPDALHVGYFHHAVTHVDTFTPDDTVEMTPAGTGGTAFSPIFERIDEMGVSPVCCVVLTDLLCSDYGPAPDYPVLWVVVPSRVKPAAPPFGDVVHMEPR
jgi:predicted metal-dependent peptidase